MKKSKKSLKTATPSTRESILFPYYSSSRKKLLLYELFEQKLGWQFTARLPYGNSVVSTVLGPAVFGNFYFFSYLIVIYR
jgi:hypothetical protein